MNALYVAGSTIRPFLATTNLLRTRQTSSLRPVVSRAARAKNNIVINSAAMTQAAVDNPLLNADPFPLWDAIKAAHVVPAIRQLLEETNDAIDELEKNVEPTGSGRVGPLER